VEHFADMAFRDYLTKLLALRDKIRSRMRGFAEHVPYKVPPFWTGQVIALACAAGGAAVRFLIDPWVHNQLPIAVFYPFVIVASTWGGTLSGLSTMIIGATLADYFWFPPGGSFKLSPSIVVVLLAFVVFCGVAILMLSLFRILLEDRVEGERRAVLLSHEMNHRVANLLGMVQAISAQTAKSAVTVAGHQALFTERLTALAQAQEFSRDQSVPPPDLREFLKRILAPFGAERFEVDGPALSVPTYLATSFALLLHELATNATKHGALSVPEGIVLISWQIQNNRVNLEWRERHGPTVNKPVRSGFGSRLLKTAFPPEYGEAEISFNPEGIDCTIRFALIAN